MMNKNFSLILLVFLLAVSCQDPASVDATRKKIVKFDPNDVPPIFSITPNQIDIAMIRPNTTFQIDAVIQNITDNNISILGASFPKLIGVASLDGLQFPLALEKQGSVGSNKDFKFVFSTGNPGFYTDTLKYPEYKNPKVVLNAKVAHVFANDLIFDETHVNGFNLKFFRIKNLSNSKVSITEFELVDATGCYINEPRVVIPLTIFANSESDDIKITFNPTSIGLKSAFIKIKAVFESGEYYYYDKITITGEAI